MFTFYSNFYIYKSFLHVFANTIWAEMSFFYHNMYRTYPLPPCRTPDFQTFPCRYSFQFPSQTSAGTPGKLKSAKDTNKMVRMLLTKTKRRKKIIILEVLQITHLLEGVVYCERTGWHWTETHQFPLYFRLQHKVSEEKGSFSNSFSFYFPNSLLFLIHTWASCLAREISTVGLSSRFPWLEQKQITS